VANVPIGNRPEGRPGAVFGVKTACFSLRAKRKNGPLDDPQELWNIV
jgi:hypothetical protein